MADWVWMQYGVVSGVRRGMHVLDGDGVEIIEGKDSFGGIVGHPIVTSGVCGIIIFCRVALFKLL